MTDKVTIEVDPRVPKGRDFEERFRAAWEKAQKGEYVAWSTLGFWGKL